MSGRGRGERDLAEEEVWFLVAVWVLLLVVVVLVSSCGLLGC